MTIDFVSTREGVDVQSQRCARLVGAVIAQALKDLTERPLKDERINKINLNKNVIRSIYFFNSPAFINYAAMVGFDGKEFLDRILIGGTTTEYNGEEWVTKARKIPINVVSEMDLRTIRARLRWRCSTHVELLPTTEEDIADEAAWDEAERLLEEKNKRALEKKERANAKGKNNNGEGSQHAADGNRVQGVRKVGGDKVDTQVSTAKRGNAKVS
jgi:hypothetical protein